MSSKPKNRGLLAALRSSEAGAIDLASIMVGIIVIGLVGGVIAATVFAVIPWAQDNAAKESLKAVETAQNAFSGLAVDGTVTGSLIGAVKATTFAPGQKFTGAKRLVELGLLSGDEKVSTTVGVDGACYIAAVTSATGNIFYNSSTDLTIKKVEGSLPELACGSFPEVSTPGGGTPVEKPAAPYIYACNLMPGPLGASPSISLTWKFPSGSKLTLADARYQFAGKDVQAGISSKIVGNEITTTFSQEVVGLTLLGVPQKASISLYDSSSKMSSEWKTISAVMGVAGKDAVCSLD